MIFNLLAIQIDESTEVEKIVGLGNECIEKWMPDACLIEQIGYHNISTEFTYNCIAEFKNGFADNTDTNLSLRSRFIKHVIQQWRQNLMHASEKNDRITSTGLSSPLISMTLDWRPSTEAINILISKLLINPTFVEDAIPEFVLYWIERGDIKNTWSSKFTLHVKNQWLRYKAALEKSSDLKVISYDWQPNNEVLDVIRTANIDVEYSKSKVPEFILYWSETGRTYPSWNTKFLQHIKYLWAKERKNKELKKHSKLFRGSIASNNLVRSTRDRSIHEDLFDRSWAD